MLPLLLLISQALGQSATIPSTPINAFSTVNTMSGEVLFKQSDATMIFVQDPSILRLRATLKVLSGEADLYAMAEVGTSQQLWMSTTVGDDEIVIEASDPKFTDGVKLMRSFVFVVVGMSQQASQYALTIKAEFATQTLAALPVSLSEFMKATERLNIHSMSLFDGVISAFTKRQTMSGELAKQQTTALLITVTNPSVKQLRATLQVASGDCDLFAVTRVNQVDQKWSSAKLGNDEIVIRADDRKFTDGQKLKRDFVFVVIGMSTNPSAYELTVTAEYAYTTLIATPAALASFVPGQDSMNLVIANEPLSAFTTRQTLKGEIEYKQADAMLITVQDPNTRILHIKLTVLSGDSDLIVVCEVNNVEKTWQSLKMGSDEIIIRANDRKFTDNKGLQRDFIVLVVGISRAVSSYELVVTANPSSTAFAAVVDDSAVMQEWSEEYERGEISAWWVLSVAAVGVAAAFWMWTDLKGAQKKSNSEFVLL